MSNENTQSHHHILPLSLYINIGLALIGLTVVTVWISFYHFGPFNLLVAMLIAATKASLVALYFMHLKYDNKLYAIIFVSSLLFLATFIVLTMFDTMRRGDIDEMKQGPIEKEAIIYRDSTRAVEGHGDSTFVEDSTQVLDTVEVSAE